MKGAGQAAQAPLALVGEPAHGANTPAFIRKLTSAAEEATPPTGDAAPWSSYLDRMDALRGRDSVLNIRNLMQANYGTDAPPVLRNLTGHGALSDEGRLVNHAGED